MSRALFQVTFPLLPLASAFLSDLWPIQICSNSTTSALSQVILGQFSYSTQTFFQCGERVRENTGVFWQVLPSKNNCTFDRKELVWLQKPWKNISRHEVYILLSQKRIKDTSWFYVKEKSYRWIIHVSGFKLVATSQIEWVCVCFFFCSCRDWNQEKPQGSKLSCMRQIWDSSAC